MRPENSDEIDIPPGGPPYTIFMGNLPDYALECDLEMMLKGLEHDRIRLVKSKDTDEFKGFAYVDILTPESLVEALKLNNSRLDEYQVRVNLADNNRGNRHQRGGQRGGNMQQENNFRSRGGYNNRGSSRGMGNYNSRGGNQRGGFNTNLRGSYENTRGSYDNSRGSYDNSRGSYDNPRGSYYTNNHRSNSTGVHHQHSQGYEDYHNYQNFQQQRPSHQNRPSRFPRGQPMRARGNQRGMQRGGGNYGPPDRGSYNNGGWNNQRGGGRGGWNHNNAYHQHPPHHNSQFHPQRSRVTSTSSRNNDPPLQPLTEEERANRPRLNLLPRSVGATSESGGAAAGNEFVLTERNVSIFGKSITRSANTSLDNSPATTMADPAIISASQMQSANSAEDVEHSPVSSGHASSSNSQKSPAGVQGDPGPHSFSTPYGDKPPDMSEHSDSGFRSEDGNGEGQNRFTPDMKQVEGRVESLQV